MSSGSSTNPFGSLTDTFASGQNYVTNTTSSIKQQYGDYFTNNYLFIGLVAVVIVCVIGLCSILFHNHQIIYEYSSSYK